MIMQFYHFPKVFRFSELRDFLMENKDRTKLYAVYILSGVLKAPDSSSRGSDGVPTCKIRRTQLVRDYDLEKFRKDYSEVDTCEIYCLNTRPIKVPFLWMFFSLLFLLCCRILCVNFFHG